ncbi:hypothetical protein BJ166DRAFT_4408 [Pestalotiopsis sp. NC0098]|nr:hypothetical protein BJ166DRAFT_4408 [Pestalotiopsis sp. NC0098]
MLVFLLATSTAHFPSWGRSARTGWISQHVMCEYTSDESPCACLLCSKDLAARDGWIDPLHLGLRSGYLAMQENTRGLSPSRPRESDHCRR